MTRPKKKKSNKNKKPAGKDADWAKAKKLCRLNTEDVRMAKQLGFKPKSLIGNIPSPSQRQKAPVKIWIRELYEKRFPKASSHASADYGASPQLEVDPQPEAEVDPQLEAEVDPELELEDDFEFPPWEDP